MTFWQKTFPGPGYGSPQISFILAGGDPIAKLAANPEYLNAQGVHSANRSRQLLSPSDPFAPVTFVVPGDQLTAIRVEAVQALFQALLLAFVLVDSAGVGHLQELQGFRQLDRLQLTPVLLKDKAAHSITESERVSRTFRAPEF